MTSAVTRPTPALVSLTARAAPVERSSTRPQWSATVIDGYDDARPPWSPCSLALNGRERWAEVRAFEIDTLARGGPAAAFVAVVGGHARRRGARPNSTTV